MKRYRKYGLNRFLLLLIIACGCVTAIYAAGKILIHHEEEKLTPPAHIIQEYRKETEYDMDSLRNLYGRNKQLLPPYERQILLALSHYPQLKDIAIHFYEDEALLPLASRPEPASMFGDKGNWQYNIIISTRSTAALEPILLNHVPFNAQVGIIGHELAHTAYYLDKSLAHMLLIAINYPFPSFRADFEKNTDRRTVAHGLGWQLLDYARYARSVMSYDQTSLGSEHYLSPADIEALIKKLY
jgi:hypothetical protein